MIFRTLDRNKSFIKYISLCVDEKIWPQSSALSGTEIRAIENIFTDKISKFISKLNTCIGNWAQVNISKLEIKCYSQDNIYFLTEVPSKSRQDKINSYFSDWYKSPSADKSYYIMNNSTNTVQTMSFSIAGWGGGGGATTAATNTITNWQVYPVDQVYNISINQNARTNNVNAEINADEDVAYPLDEREAVVNNQIYAYAYADGGINTGRLNY